MFVCYQTSLNNVANPGRSTFVGMKSTIGVDTETEPSYKSDDKHYWELANVNVTRPGGGGGK